MGRGRRYRVAFAGISLVVARYRQLRFGCGGGMYSVVAFLMCLASSAVSSSARLGSVSVPHISVTFLAVMKTLVQIQKFRAIQLCY